MQDQFTTDLSRVKIVTGGFWHGVLDLVTGGTPALTIGDSIYAFDSIDQTNKRNLALLAHEATHIPQQEEAGGFFSFLPRYTVDYFKGWLGSISTGMNENYGTRPFARVTGLSPNLSRGCGVEAGNIAIQSCGQNVRGRESTTTVQDVRSWFSARDPQAVTYDNAADMNAEIAKYRYDHYTGQGGYTK
jgi:hypothetical protein